MAEYFFENGITPPQNVSFALLSDITYINDLKGFGFEGGHESMAGGVREPRQPGRLRCAEPTAPAHPSNL